MRLFIAFPISEEVRRELEKVHPVNLPSLSSGQSGSTEGRFDRVKWVSPEQWHITVAFLGDVETQCIASLREAIENVCKKYGPMNFKLDKIDGFPNIQNPNVIVAKAIDESGTASQLQKELVDGLRKIGIEIENRPWKPHITIARNPVKSASGRPPLAGFNRVNLQPVEWKVDEVILFESELLPTGPRYTKMFSCNLS
jgi:2'-5' RNA ligase